jgi:hypothetical protein
MTEEIKTKETLFKHFNRVFLSKDDTIAFVLLKNNEKPIQVFKKIETITIDSIKKIIEFNNNGYSVYASVNPLLPNPLKRTKDFYSKNQRRLWLDLDNKNDKQILIKFKIFLSDFNLPKPNQIIQSSDGNYQIYWVLDQEYDFEILSKIMLRMNIFLKLDHTQDITRILRLPGFYNKKPGKNDYVYPPFSGLSDNKASLDSFKTLETIEIPVFNSGKIGYVKPSQLEDSKLWEYKVNSTQVAKDIYNISSRRNKNKTPSEIDLSFAHLLNINNVPMDIIKALLISSATGRKSNPEYYAQKTIEKLS